MLDQKTVAVINMGKRMKCGREHSGHKKNNVGKQRNRKIWGVDVLEEGTKKNCIFFSS